MCVCVYTRCTRRKVGPGPFSLVNQEGRGEGMDSWAKETSQIRTVSIDLAVRG